MHIITSSSLYVSILLGRWYIFYLCKVYLVLCLMPEHGCKISLSVQEKISQIWPLPTRSSSVHPHQSKRGISSYCSSSFDIEKSA